MRRRCTIFKNLGVTIHPRQPMKRTKNVINNLQRMQQGIQPER